MPIRSEMAATQRPVRRWDRGGASSRLRHL